MDRHWYDPDLGSGVLHCRPGTVRYLPHGNDGAGLVDACVPAEDLMLERVATWAVGAVVAAVLVAVGIAAVVLASGGA